MIYHLILPPLKFFPFQFLISVTHLERLLNLIKNNISHAISHATINDLIKGYINDNITSEFQYNVKHIKNQKLFNYNILINFLNTNYSKINYMKNNCFLIHVHCTIYVHCAL